MSFREQIEKLTENLLEDIIKENNYELVDVEYIKEAGNWFLRVYVDKDGGITIADCETVSRFLGSKLDEKDPIKDPYILEVSSPGLDRPLKKDKDFERSLGKSVELKLYKPIDGNKEFMGNLDSYDSETVTLEIEQEKITFDRKGIAIIRLAVIF